MSFLPATSIQPIDGIQNAVSRVEQSAREIASGKLGADPVVRLIKARREVEANLAAVKMEQAARETLLNILA